MPYDFEMTKLVRANNAAQAIFLRITLKLFRKKSRDLSSANQTRIKESFSLQS